MPFATLSGVKRFSHSENPSDESLLRIDTGRIPRPGVHLKRGAQSKWHHQKFERILEELAGSAAHLDFGCGPGTLVGLVPEQTRAVGVDIAAPQIEYARQHYPTRTFLKIEPGPLPFPDSSFTTVSCIEVVEHLTWETDVNLLRELYRVPQPGGKLVLTTPNYRSGWPVLEWCVNRVATVTYEDQHICKFSVARLATLLETAGFSDVTIRPFIFLAPFLAALHWKLSDYVRRWDDSVSALPGCGFSLLASGQK
jgi:SAM-dependent methyltransferase